MKQEDKDIIDTVLAGHATIDMKTRTQILSDIEQMILDNKPLPVKKPKQIFHIVAITDNEAITEIPMYVVTYPEDQDHVDIPENIKKAAAEHNLTPKGIKFPVDTISNAMGDVKRKFLTERGVSVKTKEPTLILTVKNPLDFTTYDNDDT